MANMKKAAPWARPFGFLHHARHSATAHRGCRGVVCRFGFVIDDTLGDEQHAGHGACIFYGDASYLGGVNDSCFFEVLEFAIAGIEA